jgi:hypothetical protein
MLYCPRCRRTRRREYRDCFPDECRDLRARRRRVRTCLWCGGQMHHWDLLTSRDVFFWGR